MSKGDSGTFGSQSTMDSIYRAKNRTKKTASTNLKLRTSNKKAIAPSSKRSLLKDTIRAIPSAAKRVAKGVGNIGVGAAASIAGSPMIGTPMVKRGIGQLKGSFKKGGKVKSTGAYKLHKGEKVIPANKVKAMAKKMKKK